MDSIPYTERRNALTTNIDTDTPEGIVNSLHQCNLEVFRGYEDHKGVADEVCLAKLDQLVKQVKSIYQDEKGVIVISGCGTSGRIGFLASTYFNQLCVQQNLPEKYRYIVSGGNNALVTSVEACEDDPVAGAAELRTATEGFERVLFIGITCGVSAPFVGGQLEYCLDNLHKFTPVLMGFNPVAMARRIQVPKWANNRTFHDIATRMEATPAATVINPIIGPEPISGSSRMKGGTATKVMLDTIFHLASTNQDVRASDIVNEFKAAVERMTAAKQSLANAVQQAGDCLLNNGSIRYIGASTFGIWGVIDASECVPTYNSAYNDIRSFVTDDYFEKSLNPEPTDSLVSPALYEATPKDISKTLEDLPEKSLVVFIDSEYYSKQVLVKQLQNKGHQIVWIKLLSTDSVESNSEVNVIDFSACSVSKNATLRYCVAETILKLSLNTISTGAHILKGKVYQNIMIDVRVSNIKLFHRATDIIESLSGVDQKTAEKCLIHSIYQTDATLSDRTVEEHIATVAKNPDHIVPIALLMCLSNYSYTQAKTDIDKCPRIRDICVNTQRSTT